MKRKIDGQLGQRIAHEHVFPFTSLPKRFIPWINSHRELAETSQARFWFSGSPRACLWGSLKVSVLCPILMREHFLGIDITWETKSWKRGNPLRIKLVKSTAWLWLAICEHKAKESMSMCPWRISDSQTSNKDDGIHLREMRLELDSNLESRKLINGSVLCLRKSLGREWDCYSREHSTRTPQDYCHPEPRTEREPEKTPSSFLEHWFYLKILREWY